MKKAIILIGALLFFAGCDYKKLEGGPVSFCESETTNIANGGGRISFVCINKQKYVKLYSQLLGNPLPSLVDRTKVS